MVSSDDSVLHDQGNIPRSTRLCATAYNLQDQTVPVKHEFEPLLTYHTFEEDAPQFRCEEVLYVSDNVGISHYAHRHSKNKGASIAGKIIVNMTFLREQNLIQLTEPEEDGAPHWKVEYDLVAIVEGRNLTYEARWPAGGNGKVQKSSQVSIAAAFKPGTT